ncbi:Ankyrin repeat domain-containing protein 50 [Mycena chlorophos]|uniref:Ankyrin repeat domain-containing protein 50 n=1 Tax=Mycena chlorophos TaxID=658473 RepID=A0A8H6TI94_MYCCL|nr:Ankyrin repeat domain-containing protein 50 [Mycena chlorophos]
MVAAFLSKELPPELIIEIGHRLSLSSLNNLICTCHHLHSTLQPSLDATLTPEVAAEVLLSAAKEGKLEIVQKLLIATDPNGYKSDRYTPLHAAAEAGHTAIVERLLAAGADTTRTCCPESQNEDEIQPLHLAVIYNHLETARSLVQHGAPVDTRYGTESTSYALSDAVLDGNTDMVKLLLQHGANVEVKYAYYGTPLGHAVRNRDVRMMTLLLEAGADPNASTPLNPGWMCGGPPAPYSASLLYFVLALKHPKGKYSPKPIPEEGREELMRVLMKYGATKESAMVTVKQHLKRIGGGRGGQGG